MRATPRFPKRATPLPSEDYELLSSPIEHRFVHRVFVIGGPIGLAIAIVLSLWVSHQRVTNAVIVQTEPQWVPGEPLALRVQITPESPRKLGDLTVEASVEQDGQRYPLPAPGPLATGGLAQGRLTVPSLTPGRATLHLRMEVSAFSPREESIPIEVVTRRDPVAGTHVVSTSMSQYADDSGEQPEAVKIDVRPYSRVLAGFHNTLLVRVTDAAGVPWSGPAAVRLVDGEMDGKRGNPDAPALLWEGQTDAAGLASIDGLLASEVLRLRVELRAEDDPDRVLHQRMIRLVSFAGAVQLRATPRRVAAGGELEVAAGGLSAKRPVFVDAYGPDGAWIGTFDPPINGREPPRAWTLPATGEGLLQLEAYHFTTAPGESTAVGRVLVDPDPAIDSASLAPLIALQRARLGLHRTDRTWDEARERAYLDALATRPLSAAAVASAERWLLGTLPIEVHGPPTLLRTHQRDLEAMKQSKRTWNFWLRLFLLGGGGLFLVAMGVLMRRSHVRDADATLAELRSLTDGEEREALEGHVAQSRRGALFRGLLFLVMMAGCLGAVALLLENLVWEF